MKRSTLTPKTARSIAGSIRTLAQVTAATALLLAPAYQSSAQDSDTRPLAASIQAVSVTLAEPLGETLLKYSVSGSTVYHYPIYKLIGASVGGRPIVDASGRLQLPAGAPVAVTVTLYDLLRNSANLAQIRAKIAEQPDVPKGSIFRFPEIPNKRPAQLILIDPNDGGKAKILAETADLAGSEQNPNPIANFLLDASAVALLKRPGFEVRADHLRVVVSERYRARFRTTDLEVTLTEVEAAANTIHRRLGALADGRSATMVLSPKVPIPVDLNRSGTIEAFNDLATTLRRSIEIEVFQRRGSAVDRDLAAKFTDEILATAKQQLAMDLQISAQERENAVATLILDDDLNITLPLGKLDEVAAEMKEDRDQKWSRAFTESRQKRQVNKVKVDTSVDGSFFGAFDTGGSNTTDIDRSWDRSDYVSSKLDSFSHQLSEASARLKGSMPYMTGIRFDVAGRIANVRFSELAGRLGTFEDGFAPLETTRDLTEVSGQLNVAQGLEALAVPQTLLGREGVIGNEGWVIRDGEFALTKEVQIQFERPFSKPPAVHCAFNVLSNGGVDPNRSILLYVSAERVTSTGFTLVFQQHPENRFYWVGASWIAVGETRVDALQAAIPRTPGSGASRYLITPEARTWASTPVLGPVKIMADGNPGILFNSIPGRAYEIESSTDLKNWLPTGQISANRFETDLPLANLDKPREFFRVANR